MKNRPDFQRLLRDIELGKIKAIACYKSDRIGCKTADLAPPRTIQTFSVVQPITHDSFVIFLKMLYFTLRYKLSIWKIYKKQSALNSFKF